MEEKANCGRSRNWGISELNRGDGRHQLVNLRTRLSIVTDRELLALPTAAAGRIGCGLGEEAM